MMTPQLVFSLYLLFGLIVFFWSEPYRPQSKAAFDKCFQASRFVWVFMVAIGAILWPILLFNLTYRFFMPRKEKQDAGR